MLDNTDLQERWPSGLRQLPAKQLYCNRYRGFESRPLRMIYILLPSYNEALGIQELLSTIDSRMRLLGLVYQAVVVDDGSSDDTYSRATAMRGLCSLEVIRHDKNRGLGEALKTGLDHIISKANDEDIMVIMDADNTHPPDLIGTMNETINNGSDIVIASRYQKGAKVIGVPSYRRMLSRGASFLFSSFISVPNVKDYTGGYRAYRVGLLRDAFKFYNGNLVTEKGFSCMVDILLKLNKLKPEITEVPLTLNYYKKRGPSKMKIAKSIKTTFGILFTNIWRKNS